MPLREAVDYHTNDGYSLRAILTGTGLLLKAAVDDGTVVWLISRFQNKHWKIERKEARWGTRELPRYLR